MQKMKKKKNTKLFNSCCQNWMLALTIVVCSRLILLLGSVFEYLGELVVIKHSVLDGRLPVHLVHLVVSEPVPDGGQQLPQSVLVNEANIVLVEAPEGILDDVLWVRSLKPLTKHGEEHGEVDGARGLPHHALQVVLGGVLAQAGQHVVQVLVVNEAVPVLVYHVEGLLELLYLVLVEHGEHIAGGSLGPLLSGPPPPGCFTRRHCLDFRLSGEISAM